VAQQQPVDEFDLVSARQAVLRYQPPSHWVSVSRDPLERMTIGFGFGVSRPEASEMLARVGLDPAAVRTGRTPISDTQMDELFDLTLLAAVDWAHRRIPGFAGMAPERQWALLELIVWLGPGGTDAVFSELAELSLPLTDEPLEPSPWFDAPAPATPLQLAGAGALAPPPASSPARAVVLDERRRSTSRERSVLASVTRRRMTFESFGLVGELASDNPDLLRAGGMVLPPGWRAADGRPAVRFGLWTDGSITVNGAPRDRAPSRRASLLKLGSIVRHHLATEAPTFTFVHAGVVDAGGCGIVIPGCTFTGKSTLVTELVRLGATYVSDEYAVLDRNGLMHPFPKPLSIRTGRHDQVGHLVLPPELVAKHPVRAGLIVVTSYAPGARWRPSVRTRAEGAFAMLENTVSARVRPASALSATSRAAGAAAVLVGRRGEARETARALLEFALLEAALLEAGGSTRFTA
jgi:hypothetical protein